MKQKTSDGSFVSVAVSVTVDTLHRHMINIFSLWRNSPTRARAASFVRFPDQT